MNILLVYFSGTGNTRYYAELLASIINERGHRCELFETEKHFNLSEVWRSNPVVPDYMIEAEKRLPLEIKLDEVLKNNSDIEYSSINKAFNNFEKYISNFDIIGFGSPVYFFEPPAVFSSFIKSLPDPKDKKAFTFATHMEGPVWFAENFRGALEERGFEITGHIDDHIIHSELLPLAPKYLAGAGFQKNYLRYRKPKIIQKIRKFLDGMNIVKGATIDKIAPAPLRPTPGIDQFVGGLVEKGLYATMKYSFGSRIIKEKCVKCGLCAKTCPMNLIKMSPETGYPVRTSHCMYCLRCINICPAEAVSYAPLYDGKARFKGFEKLIK